MTKSWLIVQIALLAVLQACASITGRPADGLIVHIPQGMISGKTDGEVETYFNIPFAAAPTGERRWRPPAYAPGWRGVRDGTQMGPACPQPVRLAVVAGGVAEFQSEDCLQLNIWRPKGAADLPVMVWIHGGAHVIGSGTFPIFDGTQLARQGVIVVTINYRLGALGYFAHPALTAEADADAPLGNFGLMDQLAALRWVQANIASFGGDPARVTLFGESAGAVSTMTLLSMPEASGLFSAAIVQSGVNLLPPKSLAEQEEVGVAAANALGLGPRATAHELREIDAEDWVKAAGARSGGTVSPFIDGRLLRAPPSQVFADGEELDVPLMIGANSNEASVLLAMGLNPEIATAYFGDQLTGAETVYGLPATNPEFARQALGDIWFVAPARWLATETSDGAPSFLYHFDYVAERRREKSDGAAHGSEITYVFDTTDYYESVVGELTPADRMFADRLSACWASFAKTRQPECALVPGWSRYDPERDEIALFAPETRIVAGFRRPVLDLILSRYDDNPH
ncbi:MAG: carboxylesterase/lipase family protein [Hyphomonas sp.]